MYHYAKIYTWVQLLIFLGDGFISLRELRLMIKSCMEENGLRFTDEQLDCLSEILLQNADTDATNTIDFYELQSLLHKHPGLTENLSRSIEKWILPNPAPSSPRSGHLVSRKCRWNYIKNNIPSVTFFFIYTLINIILFAKAVHSYRSSNVYVQLARGSGKFCPIITGKLKLTVLLPAPRPLP